MNTIVVAVGFSCITSSLVEKGEEIAMYNKARAYIIQVASPDPEFVGYKARPIHERKSRISELKKEKKELEKLAKKLRSKGIETIPLLVQGATAELILNETKRLEASLLSWAPMGTGLL